MEQELFNQLFEGLKDGEERIETEDFISQIYVEGNSIILKLTKKDNKDKKEFEDWVNQLDDDIFTEVWESLSEDFGLKELNDIYDSPNYKNVINVFKTRAKEIAEEKVKMLTKLFNL